ncbi:hypothetical protein L7F22_049794 [Adiantum nelumboides]|nr:hypothetical protein [Adiantum nelumboides]
MKDQIFEMSESPARLSSSKSSPSEFEFSMSIQGQDNSYEQTMLAADELFHNGKLLPFYNTPPGMPTTEPVIGRRRSSAEAYVMHAHSQELGRVKVEQHPISPKAPTCTSRWKELLGLKKVQIQDASNGNKLQKKTLYPSNGLAPGRRSVDSLKDPKGGLNHKEVRFQHCSRELKSNLQEACKRNVKELKPSMSHSEGHHNYGHAICNDNTHRSSLLVQSELPLQLSTADPGLCPTTNFQTQQMDLGVSSSRSSKSSDESEGMLSEAPQLQCKGSGQAAVVKQRSRAKSPTKQIDQIRSTNSTMSPRRSCVGPKGMSPARPSVANRPTESSRSAMTTRLVVKGLDRSYSNPKPTKRRPEQLRSGRQRAPTEGSRSLERSTSYSAGVRVTPVINVPMYITPGLRKGSKNGIFGLTHLFSSKKDKAFNKLSSSALHQQLHPES